MRVYFSNTYWQRSIDVGSSTERLASAKKQALRQRRQPEDEVVSVRERISEPVTVPRLSANPSDSARYLEENVVVEWRKAYINYRGLKKVIKLVNARHKARVVKELSRQPSRASSKNLISSTFEQIRRRSSNRRLSSGREEDLNDSSYLSGGAGARESYGGTGNGDGLVEEETDHFDSLPQVSLQGTGLALTSLDQEFRRKTPAAAEAVVLSKDSAVESKLEARPEADLEAEAMPVSNPPHSPTISNGQSVKGLLPKTGDNREETTKKKKKKGKDRTAKVMNLETLLAENFDSQERIFFGALDNELERIVSFYEQREADMAKRYEMLARQLRELAEHRREYKATHPQQEHWADLGHRFSHLVSTPISQPGQVLKRSSLHLARYSSGQQSPAGKPGKKADEAGDAGGTSVDEGDRRRSAALSRMFNIAGGGLSDAEDEELRRLNKAAAQSHDPERYKAARKKLKAAMLEYYRGLEILKNYKILNRTGFAKILKKFEKTTEVHCADAYYKAKVATSILVSSESVEKLLKGTEEIYTAYFEHGNRKKALERLRINATVGTGEHASTHHLSVARAGFYIGITLCALVGGLIEAFDPATQIAIPQWEGLLRVYGAELLPTLFALLFGLNLAIWHRARVNTVFIFEWDVRHALDYHQYFELPAFFLLLLSLAFWVSFLNPFPAAIAPTTWPLVWLVVVLVVLLNPLPMCIYYSRRWIIVSLARVAQGGPLYTVEFRDFFLGDELNSINWSISMLWYFSCQYNTKWATPNQCDPNKTWWTAVLLSVPAFLRLVQCLRRYADSKYLARLHLINAGKYSSSIFNYFFYINYRYHGSERTKDLALWCVFGAIYSIYTASWDITMDWSLLRRHARYPWLRDELVFESYWPFYYWAMVTNVILRFGWIIYLLPGPASSLTRIFVIALLEMLRRFQWNFLRLENEHLGNVDMYRVSREIPLPYHFKPERSKEDDEDDEEAAEKRRDLRSRSIQKLRSALGRRKTYRGEFSDDEVRPHSPVGVAAAMDINRQAQTPHEELSHSYQSDMTIENDTDNKGKQRDSSGEEQDGKDHSKRRRLGRRIIDHLVPDRGGMSAVGGRLDEVAAARGAIARDYQPRKLEMDGDQATSEEDGTSSEEEEREETEQIHDRKASES